VVLLTFSLLLSWVCVSRAESVCECLKRSAEEYRLLGYPYVWGDWDCSKFIKQIFEDCGVNFERCTASEYAKGRCGFESVAVKYLDRQDCDIPFWTWRGSDRRDGHIGMEKGRDKIYHNSSGRKKVVEDDFKGVFVRDLSKLRRYKYLEHK
jgi:NlpC/P60 family